MNVAVDEFTSPVLVTVEKSATLDKVLDVMQENGIRHLPVKEGSKVVGIISERDLLTHVGKDWAKMLIAEDIMNTDLLTASINEGLGEVALRLSRRKVGSALILDDAGEVYGIFTTTDALNALVELFHEEAFEKSDLKSLS